MNSMLRLGFITACLVLAACANQSPKPSNTSANVALRAEDQAAWQTSVQLIKQQKWPEAKSLLQTIVKNNANFPAATINLAAVNCQLQQWQEAASLLNRLSDAQKSPQALNLLGITAEHLGQLTQAEQYYLSALTSPAAPPEANYNLALLYDIYWQDPVKALPFYEAYAKARPDDKAASDWINEIKRKAKR
jgi:tetratricopeptide (TPR) repeat protein